MLRLLELLAFTSSVAAVVLKPPIRVLIAGGGPCGLLAAHCLLSRPNKAYEVDVVESREDPSTTVPGPRAYSLGLNVRGQGALSYFDQEGRSPGLLEAVSSQAVASDSFFLHLGSLKVAIRKPSPQEEEKAEFFKPPPPTLMVPRSRLCDGLSSTLLKIHGGGGRLSINYNRKVESLNLQTGEAVFVDPSSESSKKSSKQYDVIIGTDGVQSAVRKAMQQGVPDFKSEEVVLPGRYKIMLQPFPSALESGSIHAMEGGKEGYGLFLIPAPNNQTCTLVAFTAPENATSAETLTIPRILTETATAEEIKQSIALNFPLYGEPSDSAVAQLMSQRLSEARTIKCNRYHSVDGKVVSLLMGDAAHSTGGTLGQGANSALLDVVALDRCLDECGDDFSQSAALFSRRQTPEGLALWTLLQLGNLKSPWKPLYQVSQGIKGICFTLLTTLAKSILLPISKATKTVNLQAVEDFLQLNVMPTQNVLSLTTVPFTRIVKANDFWVSKVAEAGGNVIEFEE